MCVKEEVAVEVAVHRAGAHILHVMLYDGDFRLVAEAQTAFVQEVYTSSSSLLLPILELSDTHVYEP